jgi:hypothetical protein
MLYASRKNGVEYLHKEVSIMRNLVFALLLVLSLDVCDAQSAPGKPVEPAAIGVVYRLDPSSQQLKPLPDEQWKSKGKTGWVTVSGILIISGHSATFRIKTGEKAEFVFISGTPENARLYRFDQKTNERQLELVKRKGRTQETFQGVPFELTKFGASSYELAPKTPLEPGEYAIALGGKTFTFGID